MNHRLPFQTCCPIMTINNHLAYAWPLLFRDLIVPIITRDFSPITASSNNNPSQKRKVMTEHFITPGARPQDFFFFFCL